MLSPFLLTHEQILVNAGFSASPQRKWVFSPRISEIDALIYEIVEGKYGLGYNVKKLVIEDLLKGGIIDPAKVARVALENAASIAGTFITTECVISDIM